MNVVFDVDGTLMNIDHRVHYVTGDRYDWTTFTDPEVMRSDTPNLPVVAMAKALHRDGHHIVIVSARNERHRPVTLAQLEAAGVRHSGLFLREDWDNSPDAEFKEGILDHLIRTNQAPDLVVDDRASVVSMWRRRGIVCAQVAEGNF